MPYVQLQFRRGTAAQWTSGNPVLAIAELGLETDTQLFKIGDGILPWNLLPYGGLRGPTGSSGATGSTGVTGSQGMPGFATNTGTTGQTGPTGEKGQQGVQGVQGPTGSTGLAALTFGSGAPGDEDGLYGQMYVDITNNGLWGPKTQPGTYVNLVANTSYSFFVANSIAGSGSYQIPNTTGLKAEHFPYTTQYFGFQDNNTGTSRFRVITTYNDGSTLITINVPGLGNTQYIFLYSANKSKFGYVLLYLEDL